MITGLETLLSNLKRLRLLSDLTLLFSFKFGAHNIPTKFYDNLQYLKSIKALTLSFQFSKNSVTFQRFYSSSKEEINRLFSCLRQLKHLKSLALELKECDVPHLQVVESFSESLKELTNLSFFNLHISGSPGPYSRAVASLLSSLEKLPLLSTIIISIESDHNIDVGELENIISDQTYFDRLSYVALEFHGYSQRNEHRRYVFNLGKAKSDIEP